MIRFGPSGNSQSFYDQGYQSSVQMPRWLSELGLNAYEYQCSKGIKIGREMAEQLGDHARKYGVFLSIHAPYYINLASEEPEKRLNSKKYILDTLKVAQWMGAERIVVHTGSCSKIPRELALKTAMNSLKEVIREADDAKLSQVAICPEVLGKLNQLGSLEEILHMCRMDERLIPTVDFGHLHARGMGCLNSPKDFLKVLETIENALGAWRLKHLHCHFSRIEFTAGGEKKHWTMDDLQYGPEFEHLAEMIVKKQMEPVVICESRDHMAEDALKMKSIYEACMGGNKS